MKTSLELLALAALGALLAAAPAGATVLGPELVVNGGFEADYDTTAPQGWSFVGAAGGAQAAAVVGPSHSGNELYFFGNHVAFDTLSQIIPTVKDQYYRVETWLAIDNFISQVNPINSIDGEFNGQTFLFAQDAPDFPFDPFHPNAAYVLMTADIRAYSDLTLLQFMGAASTGDVYIDDVSVRQILPDPIPGGVPEPAAWALMLLGFGGVGFALRRRKAAVAALAATLSLTAGAASATTVDFFYELKGATKASGAFTYATGKTGVLGYGDLSAFKVTLEGLTYDLADALALTNYNYFAYDTAAGQFVPDLDACGSHGCGFKRTLAATDLAFDSGFYFNVPGSGFEEYSTGQGSGFDAIVFRVEDAVPEPAAWTLMLAGFALTGAMIRRRREDHPA